MIPLHEKLARVLITGGSRGIGLAIARRLLECGVQVHYCSRRPSAYEHPAFVHVAADLADTVWGPKAVIEHFEARGIAPDGLVCAAGTICEALVFKQADQAIEKQFAVNMTSHIKLIQWAAVPMMRARFGRIVAVSSTAARFPAPGQSVYAAAKAGLEAFLKGCAVELAGKGVTCNRVVPGYIITDFSREYLESRDLRKVVPVGRAGIREEVAEAVLLFLGANSGYLTGSEVVVDGGLSLAVK